LQADGHQANDRGGDRENNDHGKDDGSHDRCLSDSETRCVPGKGTVVRVSLSSTLSHQRAIPCALSVWSRFAPASAQLVTVLKRPKPL
jgi:hypothetical protein